MCCLDIKKAIPFELPLFLERGEQKREEHNFHRVCCPPTATDDDELILSNANTYRLQCLEVDFWSEVEIRLKRTLCVSNLYKWHKSLFWALNILDPVYRYRLFSDLLFCPKVWHFQRLTYDLNLDFRSFWGNAFWEHSFLMSALGRSAHVFKINWHYYLHFRTSSVVWLYQRVQMGRVIIFFRKWWSSSAQNFKNFQTHFLRRPFSVCFRKWGDRWQFESDLLE